MKESNLATRDITRGPRELSFVFFVIAYSLFVSGGNDEGDKAVPTVFQRLLLIQSFVSGAYLALLIAVLLCEFPPRLSPRYCFVCASATITESLRGHSQCVLLRRLRRYHDMDWILLPVILREDNAIKM